MCAMFATDLTSAERFCGEMARREAKNFYWGFISLPYDQRIAIYALYDFARQIDDEADVARGPGLPERLAAYRERVSKLMSGVHSDPVTQVLARAVTRFAIPEAELQELIDGVEVDAHRMSCEGTAGSSLRWSDGCACVFSVSPTRLRLSALTIWASRCNSPTFCAMYERTQHSAAYICRPTTSAASA